MPIDDERDRTDVATVAMLTSEPGDESSGLVAESDSPSKSGAATSEYPASDERDEVALFCLVRMESRGGRSGDRKGEKSGTGSGATSSGDGSATSSDGAFDGRRRLLRGKGGRGESGSEGSGELGGGEDGAGHELGDLGERSGEGVGESVGEGKAPTY